MSTLVMKTEAVIAIPPYGQLADTTSNLRFALDARDIEVANGADVTAWVSKKGTGTGLEKVFNNKFASYNYPKFSNTSIPTVNFDGNSILFNNNDDDVFVGTCTYVLVCRIDDLAPVDESSMRIFSGDLGDIGDDLASPSNYHLLALVSGDLRITCTKLNPSDPNAVYGANAPIGTGYWVGVFVLDGSNSKQYISTNGVMQKFQLASGLQDRIYLGGSSSKSSGSSNSAFKGGISYFAQYDRAMSEIEMLMLVDQYKREFGV